MEKVKVLSLFNGISCGRVAFERAGIEVAKKNYPNDEYKRWNSSKNLRKPTILRKEPIKDKGWYNRIARLPKKLEKSYCLDGDSVREGIHEKTGYTFFTYTFVRINQTWKETELEWEKL